MSPNVEPGYVPRRPTRGIIETPTLICSDCGDLIDQDDAERGYVERCPTCAESIDFAE